MIKKALKKMIPNAVHRWRQRRLVRQRQQTFSEQSAAETFSEIYSENIWGGDPGDFYSGDGSAEAFAEQYSAAVKQFIAANGIENVVDLGCGDFRVASKIVSDEIKYTGVDVVASLIEHHKRNHANENVDFLCLDIAEDELPQGELCLIRQVLQHLSNAEIGSILKNCQKYKFLIITEHYPRPELKAVPNLDIPHGPGMRVFFDSAVFLDQPPFNLKNISLMLDVEAEERTRIKTFLIRNETGNP